MKARFLALAALVLGLASCQTEPEGLDVNVGGEEVNTVLTVTIPETETRAAGTDSAKGGVTNVDMSEYDVRFILEVYDEAGELAKERLVEYEDNAQSTSFNLRLIPGRNYKFVVWADFVPEVDVERDPATNYDYHYNTANGLRAVEVNTTSWDVIDESRDAYTAVELIKDFSASTDIDITLTRPFAKLRVVTNDIEEMISIRPAEVKVEYFNTTFYDTFDAYAETASGEYTGHALTATLLDSEKNPVDVYSGGLDANDGVQTLFADYFFGAKDDRVMFTMDVKDNGGVALPQVTFNTNIPVQRNMLTTVYGPVLTDSNNITVTIDEAFENGTNWNPGDDKYDVEIWDGKTLTAPKYNATDDVYEISTGSQLAYFAASMNGTLPATAATRAEVVNYYEETIVLTADIDLGGNEWTPIGVDLNHAFAGSFDGQNHKVANFVISGNATSQAALFGVIRGSGSFKNVVVDNATVLCPVTSGETNYYGAGFAAQLYGTHTFENITVQNSKIQGSGKTGGLIGFNGDCAQVVKNCHVVNCVVESTNPEDGGNIGGLVGFWQCVGGGSSAREFLFENCSVKETTINAFNSANAGKRANAEFLGGFKSATGWTLNIDHCTVAKNTFNETINGEDAVTYKSKYDGVFVGGDRTGECLATVIINGTRYEGTEEPKNVSAEDGEFYATIDEAVKAGNKEVTLGAGNFNLKSFSTDLTITGVNKEDTNVIIDTNTGDAQKINFVNVTVTRTPEANYRTVDMVTTQENYENCIINGCVRLLVRESATFTNCEFRNTQKSGFNGYSIHYYAYNGSKVYVNNCTFSTVSKGICIFNEGVNEYYLEVNDSEFTASETDDKAAIQMHTEKGIKGTVVINNTTATGFANVNDGLWNEVVNSSDNIYGLASQTPTNNFTIIVDGETAQLAGFTFIEGTNKGVAERADKKEYRIYNKLGLEWLATQTNDGNKFQGVTVALCADIDLNNEEWTPIGTSSNPFNGTFDGQNKKISNLVITGNKSDVGLFGRTNNGEIKNLVVENAKVSGYLNVAVVAGTPYTSKYNNITVQGHVEINGFSYVGAVGGKNAYASWSNVTVNVDETSYINANSISDKNYRTYVGGVCGFMGEGTHSFTDVTSNIDVKGTTCDVGGIVGIAHEGNSFIRCASSGDVEICSAASETRAQEIGGIAGVWMNKGRNVTFTECEFTGSLKSTNADGEEYAIETGLYGGNLVCGAYYAEVGDNKLVIDGIEYQYAVAVKDIAALEAALEGDAPIVVTETIKVAEGEELVVDFNNKAVKTAAVNAFMVPTGAKLTLKNGDVTSHGSIASAQGGEVVIESGKYVQTGTAVGSPAPTYRYGIDAREGGKIIINGGEFESSNGILNVNAGCELVINGGKFTNNVEKSMTRHFAYVSGKLTINDGEFYGVANSAAGGCFFCGAAAGCDIQINGGKFTSLWSSGSVNRIFEVYYGGTINVTGGLFNTNGGIASFVEANTDPATKDAYPYKAK